jgi:alpha-ketoglutarate-dependent taurine dioxygenase
LVLDMPVHDLSGLPEAERTRQASHLATDHAARPFDLASGPLVRAELIRLDERLWHMPIAMHHIIADGWSVGVFARDLAAAYRAVRAGHSPQWRPLVIQYADYAVWQQAAFTGARLEAEQIFWRDRLHNAPTTLALPTDRPRPPIASTAGGALQFVVPVDLASAVEQWASARGATCFMALLTLFLTLLHQESGADDLVIGTDVAGRPAPELEELIGFFVNVVPVRSRASDGDSFNARLDRIRQAALDTFAHEQLPFDRIVEAVGARQDRSRNPLVQHLLVLQNMPDGELHLDDCTIRQLPAAGRHSKFDIALFIEPARPTKDGSPARPMKADWVFASALYDSATIRRLHGRWIALMEKAVTDPDQPALTALAAAPTPRAPNAPAFNLTTLGRKATDRFAPTGVHQSMLAPGCAMPAVLQPAAPGMAPSDWAKSNIRLIEELLLDRGALLFRGFDLPDAPAFRAFAEAMEPAGLYGAYGDLPPSKEAEGLYNSTPYPEQEMIFFHNESSHLSQWPRKQWFFAQEVATSGGCTPIVDCRAMLRRLPRVLVEEFERRGLLYVRTFTPHLDVGWRDFFRTDSREEVNARCARDGMECYWLDEETPQTRLAAPAVIRHPTTGERVFFNQVQLHHPQCLDPEIRSDLLDIVGIDRFPRNVLFGDGEAIADETMALIGQAYEDCAVRFPWQRGDMLMLDNMLTAHARDPFEGSRRVFVAMAGLVSRSDIAHASQEKVA